MKTAVIEEKPAKKRKKNNKRDNKKDLIKLVLREA